ncbi:MAG TPA: hypothetical protein VJZ93_01975 [Candidatus Nanoarchaeia archaeon]|nr:hypothetical protein [Candidatus Nanoarchaeia archaeon]
MDKKIVLWIIIVITLIALILMVFFPNIGYVIRDYGKSNSEDICSPPVGMSEEKWREHMSHHPNLYKGCLEG